MRGTANASLVEQRSGRGTRLALAFAGALLAFILLGGSSKAAEPEPSVDRSWVESVTGTSAVLWTAIDANGLPTAYHFEWGTDTSYGHSAPAPDGNAGEGDTSRWRDSTIPGPEFSHPLSGLALNTTYHFRVVATNSAGTTFGPDHEFHTFPAAKPFQLPDNRAYEMVSPVDKGGNDVATLPWRTTSSLDGNHVMYSSLGSFSGPQGNALGNDYVSERSADGWVTHSVTPPQKISDTSFFGNPAVQTTYVSSISPDFSTGIVQGGPIFGDNSNTSKRAASIYVRTDVDSPGPGQYQLVNDCLAPPAGPCSEPLEPEVGFDVQSTAYAGASADFKNIIFDSRDNLFNGAIGNRPKLYEWEEGTLRLAGVLPDGSLAECDSGNTCSVAGGGAGARGEGNQGRIHRTESAISADGSRVFFTAPPYEESGFGGGELYVRENHQTTTRIDASERTDCSGDPTCDGDGVPDPMPDPTGPLPATFLVANRDGTKVLFITPEQMNDEDANVFNPGNPTGSTDIYMWDSGKPAGERLTLISRGSAGSPGAGGQAGIATMTNDGSFVYFSSGQQLVAGEPPILSMAGLFVWHDGEVRYIGDFVQGPSEGFITTVIPGGFYEPRLDSRMTPDGELFTFGTRTIDAQTDGHVEANLTNYDNRSINCPAGLSYGCDEVYVYDYATDELVCPSCNPLTGAAPTNDAGIQSIADAGVVRNNPTQRLNRALTADGKYLFFNSPDPLVPEDTNGRIDAYRYEVATGKLTLISTGQCACNSYFVEASPDAHDIFITTRQQLVGIDEDNSADLYDVRVDGGIAAQNPLPPFECQGDACQPTPNPPNDATPASASFEGSPAASNARSCRKGTKAVKRKGKVSCRKTRKAKQAHQKRGQK